MPGERERIERALRESEERFRGVYLQSPIGIEIYDAKGLLVDVNPACLEIFGVRSVEDVRGFKLFEDPNLPERAKAALASGQSVHFDMEFDFDLVKRKTLYRTAKSGKVFLEVLLTPLATNGKPDGYLAHVLDVTARRRSEIALQRQQERQLELERQLVQSQKMEGIGRLAGGIAHDFNNYLTAIQGYIDLALDEIGANGGKRKPPASREQVRKAAANLAEGRICLGRAAQVARQLMLFSRQEPADMQAVDLNGLVQEMKLMLERLIGPEYVISTSLQEQLWPVRADSGHIEQVLMNLTLNARDAMPGGGEITITTRNRETCRPAADAGPLPCVELAVADHGAGMDEETRSSIFDPFFSTKGREGTGLGLSVVYGIVRAHGGWIEVESAPGAGSTFRIFLPASRARMRGKTRSATKASSAEERTGGGR